MKKVHQERVSVVARPPFELTDHLAELLLATARTNHVQGVNMDFRNATFKVGGEGGLLGGAGGQGGVLNLIGSYQPPGGAILTLDGEPGRAPGAGGGGGGSVGTLGRAVTTTEIAQGFRVSSIFTVNAFTCNGTFNALGGGWTYMPLPQLPFETVVKALTVFELGRIADDSLVLVQWTLISPSGMSSEPCEFVINAHAGDDLARRRTVPVLLPFIATEFGLWTLRVASGDQDLARYTFEIRQGAPIACG
jgi:hypothetical protein